MTSIPDIIQILISRSHSFIYRLHSNCNWSLNIRRAHLIKTMPIIYKVNIDCIQIKSYYTWLSISTNHIKVTFIPRIRSIQITCKNQTSMIWNIMRRSKHFINNKNILRKSKIINWNIKHIFSHPIADKFTITVVEILHSL